MHYPNHNSRNTNSDAIEASLKRCRFRYVVNSHQMHKLAKKLRKTRMFAFDVEHTCMIHTKEQFVCLLQVSTRHHDYIIDLLNERGRPSRRMAQHMSLLREAFADKRIRKVVHGSQDTKWLMDYFGIKTANCHNTNAGGIGLKVLVERECGVQLDKRGQKWNWARRPLTSAMMHYARCDTHFLYRAYRQMEKRSF